MLMSRFNRRRRTLAAMLTVATFALSSALPNALAAPRFTRFPIFKKRLISGI